MATHSRYLDAASHGPSALPALTALLAAGAFASFSQVLLLRELMVAFSGSELSVGLLLAGWLGGVSWGAASGARQVSRHPEMAAGLARGALLSSAALLLGTMLLARVLRVLLAIPPGEEMPIGSLAVSALVLSGLLSFPFGLQFPALARLPLRGGRPAAARAYGLEAVGSLLGGMGLTLLLMAEVEHFSLAISASAALVAVLTLLPERSGAARAWPRTMLVSLAAGLMLCAALGLGPRLGVCASRLRLASLIPGASLVARADSRRAEIELARRGESWLLLQNGRLAATLPDPHGQAPRMHLAALAHPGPRRILLIGGWLGGALEALLMHPSIEVVDLLSEDPGLPALLARSLPRELTRALLDHRVRLWIEDGRHFLNRRVRASASEAGQGSSREGPAAAARLGPQIAPYDLIVLDLPDPESAGLNRFYTREFFELAAGVLDSGGVLVTRVSGSANALSQEQGVYSGTIFHALNASFADLRVLPGDEHRFLAARSPGVLPRDLEEWDRRREERGLGKRGYLRAHLSDRMPPDRCRRLLDQLEQSSIRVNRDHRPISIYHHLLLWSWRVSGRGPGWLLSFLLDLSLAWLLAPVALAAALLLMLSGRGRAGSRGLRMPALLHMGSSGLAGMAGELVMLLAFQSQEGDLYLAVGALVACFMAGLAAASLLLGPRLSRVRTVQKLRCLVLGLDLGWILLLLGLWPLSEQLLPGLGLSLWGYAATMLLLGLATGASFPLALALYRVSGEVPRRRDPAGELDSADHLGAAAGALATGALLLPLLGVLGTLLTVAAVKLLPIASLARK